MAMDQSLGNTINRQGKKLTNYISENNMHAIFLFCMNILKFNLNLIASILVPQKFLCQYTLLHSEAIGVFRNAFLGNCHFDDFRQPC